MRYRRSPHEIIEDTLLLLETHSPEYKSRIMVKVNTCNARITRIFDWLLDRDLIEKTKVKRMPRRRYYRKKRSNRGGGFNYRSVFPILNIAALAAPGVQPWLVPGLTNEQRLAIALQRYSGYDMMTNTWNGQALMAGWMPFIGTKLMTTLIPKLSGMISRIL